MRIFNGGGGGREAVFFSYLDVCLRLGEYKFYLFAYGLSLFVCLSVCLLRDVECEIFVYRSFVMDANRKHRGR